MKSLLISIKPKWCAEIMNGNKTIEVRKNKALASAIQKLIDENGFADIYVYCSKFQNGKSNTLGKMKNGEYKIITNANDVLEQIDEIDKAKFTGKVIFKFRCYKVEEIYVGFGTKYVEKGLVGIVNEHFDYSLFNKSCLTELDLVRYLKPTVEDYYDYCDMYFYAIHISDLEIFDKPKELGEFKGMVFYTKCKDCPYINDLSRCEMLNNCHEYTSLTKAPQNFRYIEEELL